MRGWLRPSSLTGNPRTRGGHGLARGGAAKSLKEEFEVYGVPAWAMGTVGFLRLLFATLLLVGIWYTPAVRPAAIGMLILMIGAISMHVKVGDPAKRSLPAFTMLVLSAIVAFA